MAIKKYFGDRISGLSSDAKPTNVLDGQSLYRNKYTKKIYLKISGAGEEVDYNNYTDATSDGKTYGRKDGDWAEITGSSSDSIEIYLLLHQTP